MKFKLKKDSLKSRFFEKKKKTKKPFLAYLIEENLKNLYFLAKKSAKLYQKN